MIPVLTAENVRAQDASSPIPVEQLMENAGRAVARAARRMMGGCYGRRVVVVCGKGNNAGDGLVAARVLAYDGAAVTVVKLFDELNELATFMLARFNGRVVGIEHLAREIDRSHLVIDAIFGVGLTRAPSGDAEQAIGGMNGRAVLSIDVPSGVNSDTGSVPGIAVSASACVTFGGYKPGLMFELGRSHAGVVEVADIGTGGEPAALAPEAHDVVSWWPLRTGSDHKRSAGTTLIVAGSRAMPGAAALVAGAAVHAGSGLTVLCAPEDVCRVVVARLPEITTIPVPDTSEGTLDGKALDLIRPRFDEFHAAAIGPGLTTHPATAEFVRALVAEAPFPIVLDADGLNAFTGDPSVIAARAPRVTVLTPHAGELSRLAGVGSVELGSDRLGVAKRIAAQLSSVLVFKGPGSVIAGGPVTFVNPTGGAALAQGGTGDALTGMIASVLAQTVDEAAAVPLRVAAAVWLHGHAADRIAHRIAPHPANASALIDEIGPALREVFA